ncbi:MAG: hypothetical protein ACREMW_07925 [Gemmatimonadales bacterium]
MSLNTWLANGWIVKHQATREEIANLVALVDRDIASAALSDLPADWKLGIAYNAALQLATAALAVSGYRPGRERHHERAILSLRFTLGISTNRVDVIDAVRRKRNRTTYEHIGGTSDAEASQFHDAVIALRGDFVSWLKKEHPTLCPPGLVVRTPRDHE